MHCYQALEAATVIIIRSHPRWLAEVETPDGPLGRATPDAIGRISRTVLADNPDPAGSDEMVRQLVGIARTNPDALTVLLHVVARRLRKRIRTNATWEYHSDALAILAIALLEDPLDNPRIVKRMVNRAHNKIWRERTSERHRGKVHPVTIDPCEPDVLARIGGRAADDVAEVAVRNADLALFHSDIQHRIATGMLPEATWTNYRDFHLRRELVAHFHRTTAERVRVHRAIPSLQHLFERHLVIHAA